MSAAFRHTRLCSIEKQAFRGSGFNIAFSFWRWYKNPKNAFASLLRLQKRECLNVHGANTFLHQVVFPTHQSVSIYVLPTSSAASAVFIFAGRHYLYYASPGHMNIPSGSHENTEIKISSAGFLQSFLSTFFSKGGVDSSKSLLPTGTKAIAVISLMLIQKRHIWLSIQHFLRLLFRKFLEKTEKKNCSIVNILFSIVMFHICWMQ